MGRKSGGITSMEKKGKSQDVGIEGNEYGVTESAKGGGLGVRGGGTGTLG